MKYAWTTSRCSAGSFGFQGMLLDAEEASKLRIAPNWLPVSSAFYTAGETRSWHYSSKVSPCETLKSRATHYHKYSITPLTPVVLKAACSTDSMACVDRKMHSCHELMNRASGKVNVHSLCCHLPLWRQEPADKGTLLNRENNNNNTWIRVSCSFSLLNFWLQKQTPLQPFTLN